MLQEPAKYEAFGTISWCQFIMKECVFHSLVTIMSNYCLLSFCEVLKLILAKHNPYRHHLKCTNQRKQMSNNTLQFSNFVFKGNKRHLCEVMYLSVNINKTFATTITCKMSVFNSNQPH